MLASAAAWGSAGQALASGVTNSGDDLRDGWYPEEASLTPEVVGGGSFGQLWSATVQGQVYAQPLLADGTLLVASEDNEVYGLDPSTGAMRWPSPLSLGPPWRAADIGCEDLAPDVGVTATPVIDPSTETAYLTHKTYESGTSGPAAWYMDAIDLATGAERPGFPVRLAGTAQNQPGETFQATTQLQRPGLLLMNGVVYAAFGSDCDTPPWQGWVFGVSTAGEVRARWVDVASGNGAGIWQSGSGLMSDGSGTLLLSTGNGGSPSTPTPGHSPPASLGESIVRLQVQPDGTLEAVDFFAPFDAQELDEWDADFASGGVTGLDDEFFGTPSIPHLAVAVGKDGYVYLLDRDDLGGFQQGPDGGDAVVQRIGPYGGVWSRPGVWPGDGGWVYIPTASGGNSAGGSSGFLRVYQYGISGTGEPTLSLQATSAEPFGFTSSAPVITSDGTTSGSALVWIVWAPSGSGVGAQLRAYDPIPVEGRPVMVWSAPIGTSAKFAMPGVGAGRIYVGTREGKVLAFGSPVTPPLSGPATSFPTTTLGQSSQRTLTLTATTALTLQKLTSSSSQFTLGTPSPALPAQLSAGQTIEIPVTFTPTQTGLVGATLSAETDQGDSSFGLSGAGAPAAAQLSSTPAVVSLGGTTLGGHLSGAATFRNVGGAPLTITGVKLPAAPFSVAGTPAPGQEIAPGGAITVTISFDPTSPGSFDEEIVLETTAGNAAVGLTASAGPATYGPPPAVASVEPASGPSAGGTFVRIRGSRFLQGAAVTIGSPVRDVHVVSEEEITATTSAAAAGPEEVVVSDENGSSEGSGPDYTYTPPTGSSVPDPTAGGWQLNGTAALASNELVLTTAAEHEAGSAFWPAPLDPRNMTVEFDASIGGGTGADGLALVLGDASRGATPESLGVEGGGLGFSGIPGLAVALDEYQNAVNPSNDFVGVSDGPTASAADELDWLATANLGVPLQNSTHHVAVTTAGGTLTVSVDGTRELSTAASLPSSAYLGFSAGTGGLDNRHAIANLLVRSEPAPASLSILSTIDAPAGSPQAATQLVFSGACPSDFATAALGSGESAQPALTGAIAGAPCTVSEAQPPGGGWTTTASVDGGPEALLSAAGGWMAAPSFTLAEGVNTVHFTSTYAPPLAPPAGEPLAATPLQQALATLSAREHAALPTPDAELASTALTASPSGTIVLEIGCPAAESSCAGSVALRSLTALPAAGATRSNPRHAAVLTFASGTFTVAGGHRAAVRLRLSSRARALLGRSGVLRARTTILAHDPAGATHTAHAIVTIRPAARTHRRSG